MVTDLWGWCEAVFVEECKEMGGMVTEKIREADRWECVFGVIVGS